MRSLPPRRCPTGCTKRSLPPRRWGSPALRSSEKNPFPVLKKTIPIQAALRGRLFAFPWAAHTFSPVFSPRHRPGRTFFTNSEQFFCRKNQKNDFVKNLTNSPWENGPLFFKRGDFVTHRQKGGQKAQKILLIFPDSFDMILSRADLGVQETPHRKT